MLEYTKAGDGARLAMLVLHDDAKREYAYGPAQGLPDTKVGTFTQALYDEAKKNGWTVVSMKNDWKRSSRSRSSLPLPSGPAIDGKEPIMKHATKRLADLMVKGVMAFILAISGATTQAQESRPRSPPSTSSSNRTRP